MGVPLRFEPLPPTRFPVGQGPFRARGLAYVVALKYVDTRLRGGRDALRAALGPGDPYAPYYEQIFLVTGDYDVSPLVRLYVASAGIEGVSVGRFVEERARWSAEADSKGVWRPMLKADTPEQAAERSAFAFNRYFPPCQAVPVSARPGRFEAELAGLPACMTGLYGTSTAGFVSAAITLAGGTAVRTEWERPAPDGVRDGVPLERLRFVMTWR